LSSEGTYDGFRKTYLPAILILPRKEKET